MIHIDTMNWVCVLLAIWVYKFKLFLCWTKSGCSSFCMIHIDTYECVCLYHSLVCSHHWLLVWVVGWWDGVPGVGSWGTEALVHNRSYTCHDEKKDNWHNNFVYKFKLFCAGQKVGVARSAHPHHSSFSPPLFPPLASARGWAGVFSLVLQRMLSSTVNCLLYLLQHTSCTLLVLPWVSAHSE